MSEYDVVVIGAGAAGLRANARVVRRKMSGYNVKRAQHRDGRKPTLPICSAIHILNPA